MAPTSSASPKPAAIRLRLTCPGLPEYRARLLGQHRDHGVFLPPGRSRPRPVGSRVLLKIELADGTLAFSGPALVAAHVRDGSQIGLLLTLDRGGFEAVEPPRPAPRPAEATAPQAAVPPPLPPPLPPPTIRREVALRLKPTPPPLPRAAPPPVAPPKPSTAAPGVRRGPAGAGGVTAASAALVAGTVRAVDRLVSHLSRLADLEPRERPPVPRDDGAGADGLRRRTR